MSTRRLWIHATVCSALLAIVFRGASASSRQTPLFTEPVLVKGSPTNHSSFDVSWNDNSTQRYYLADRTNNAIDLVDSATDTFLGFIGKGHYTGAKLCAGTNDGRHCA